MASSGSLGNLVAYLRLNDKGFVGPLKRAQARTQKFQKAAMATGRTLTTHLSMPLALAGGAAVKMATDFDRSMTKVETLVGRSGAQINQWREDLLKLAPEVGKGPGELADALFFVTSAGVESAKALDVVRNAAMASAVGLGETKTVADAVVSAMAAWKQQGLSAAEATDVLVATVRYGKLEASDLAGVLGRVTSTAAILGVSFAEVGAAIATFSRAGANAEIAATALRGALNIFLSPAQKTSEALAKLNIDVNDVQKSIREDGLAVAMVKLIGGFKGNINALGQLIPNVRALALVLSNAASQGEDYVQIAEKITKSEGMTSKAFARTQKTFAFQFDVFKAKVEVLGVALGTQLTPMLLKVADKMGVYLDKMGQAGAETLVMAAAAMIGIAALGPFVLGVAGLTKGFLLLATSIKLVWLALTGIPGLIALGIAAFAALIITIFDTDDAWGELLSSIPLIGGVLDTALGYAKATVRGIGVAILEGLNWLVGKMAHVAIKMNDAFGGRFGTTGIATSIIGLKEDLDELIFDMEAKTNDMWVDIAERAKNRTPIVAPFSFDIGEALEDSFAKVDLKNIKSALDGLIGTMPADDLRKQLQGSADAYTAFFTDVQNASEDAFDITDTEKFNREVERGILELTKLHTNLASSGKGSQNQLEILAKSLGLADTKLETFVDHYTAQMDEIHAQNERIADSIRMNIGETISGAMDEMFTGFLRGTRDLESLTEIWSNSMIAIVEDMFSQFISSKLSFDDIFVGNFMEDLLPMVKDFAGQAIQALGGLFNQNWNLFGVTPADGTPGGYSEPIKLGALSYASGGITTGPQLAMVGDNPSGREAIIPLERWGEVMGGGGGGDVSIVIHSPQPVASQKRRQGSDGKEIFNIIFQGAKSAVASDIMDGGPVAKAIQASFGSSRSGGR